MYLAFRWLVFLSFASWALLCLLDMQMKLNRQISNQSFHKPLQPLPVLENNLTKSYKARRVKQNKSQDMVLFNYFTFFAGALMVFLYDKRAEIMKLIQRSIKLSKEVIISLIQNIIKFTKEIIVLFDIQRFDLKETALLLVKGAILTCVAIFHAFAALLGIIKEKVPLLYKQIRSLHNINFLKNFSEYFDSQKGYERNIVLLKRLREMGLERNKLAQLLVVAITENRHIKSQCHAEIMTRQRLTIQLQEMQKRNVENRSKYNNFQHLYSIMYQENKFLRDRIKIVTRDKEQTAAILMSLVGQIYRSNDYNLKAHCANFISNIQPKAPTQSTSDDNARRDKPNSILKNLKESDLLQPYENDEPKPKLLGLPGEYVWTIKDKDGIIEKLYEYDYGYNFDNGDTIRRIREYSVYHDKDCIFEMANSSTTTIVPDLTSSTNRSPRPACLNLPRNKNFLTQSPHFKAFMRNNFNCAVAARPPSKMLQGV